MQRAHFETAKAITSGLLFSQGCYYTVNHTITITLHTKIWFGWHCGLGKLRNHPFPLFLSFLLLLPSLNVEQSFLERKLSSFGGELN